MNTEVISVSGVTQASPRATSESHSLLGRIFVKGTVIIITLLACLVMLEVGLRIIHRYPMGNSEGYFAQGGISYVLKKNITKEVVWPTMSFTVHTSDLGFRSSHPGPQEIGKRPYYVVLGASDAFGNGLDYEKTFVGIYAEKMKREHNIDLVNMAIAGHHLLEQEALLKKFVSSASRPPEAVLIIFNPLFVGGYDDIHPDVIVRRGDLFEGEKWRIALMRKILANTSTAYCFFRDAVRNTQYRYFPRQDSDLSFYIEKFSSTHRIHQPEKTQDFSRRLQDLTQFIRSLNAVPIYVYCPPAGELLMNDLTAKRELAPGLIDTKIFSELVQKHCQAEKVEFLNLQPLVQERYDKGEKLTFDGDGHFNGPTSQIVGDYLFKVLDPLQKRKQN